MKTTKKAKSENNHKMSFGRILAAILLSAVIALGMAHNAYAWGPSSPSGSTWVTGDNTPGSPAPCTFTWETSGIYDFNNVMIDIYNNGTWVASSFSTNSKCYSWNFNLPNQSPTGNSYWRVRFYKWDGVDMYGNPTGAVGWTGWSGWSYFGVDFTQPTSGSKIAPANNLYTKNPVTVTWNPGSDNMSGVKDYRITVTGIADQTSTSTSKTLPTLSQGWHTYNIYVRDNSFNNAFDSSTHWETLFTDAARQFFIDDIPPTPGAKTDPPHNFAINPDAPVAGVNDYNPSPYTTGNKVNFAWTQATDGGSGVYYYNLSVTNTNSGSSATKTIFHPTTTYNFGGAADAPLTGLPNGLYNWNVTAYDRSLNSAVYGGAFNMIIDRTAPSPATKTNPKNLPDATAYTSSPTVSFSWAGAVDPSAPAASGIQQYNLYIAPSSGAYGPNFNCGGSTSRVQNISAAPFGFATEGKYKWNLRVYDRAMNYSWYSPDFEFIYDKTPPQAGNKVNPFCVLPDKYFCTNSTTVTFSWTAASDLPAGDNAGVNYYELIIDGTPRWTGAALTATIGGLAEGLHTWNVKVYDKAGNSILYDNGDTSDWKFKVDLTKPTAGTKINPVNNFKTNSTSITFQWDDSLDTNSGVDRIDLIVSGPVTFTVNDVRKRWSRDPASTDYTTSAFGAGTYTASGLSDGVYTWNVRAWDRAGNWALYNLGVDWKFTIDSVKPTAGAKVSPIDGTITKNNILTFTWTAGNDIVSLPATLRYYVYVDGSPINALPVVGGTTYTNTVAFADGDHVWNVRVYDEAGNYIDYGAGWKFKVDTVPPVPGTLYGIKGNVLSFVAPDASGVDIDSGTPKFSWSAASDPAPGSGIDMYRIVIEIPRGAVKFDSGYTIANVADAEFAPNIAFLLPDANKLADDGPYYWTIYVRDIAGNVTKYPVQWNFYVDTLILNEVSQYNMFLSRANLMVPATPGSPATYQPSPAYEININTLNDNYTPVADIVPDPPSAANNYGTTFYWSVMNQDISGMWGKYEDYSINIVTLLPGSLIKPVDKALCPIKPKFEWSHSMPQEVRRKYRLVVYPNAWNSGAPVINWSTPWSDTGDLPTTYQAVTALPDGKYYWSVYATNDMTSETQYPQIWSFEIIRKPFVNMISTNLKWYAGYGNGLYVDAFGANGYDTLGTCEVTVYKDAAGTQPIRRYSVPTSSSVPPKMTILDGDTFNRLEPPAKTYTLKSFTYVDEILFPSNKRYVMNLSPHYNYIPYYPSKVYAKARVYFYDSANPADMSIYTDYPAAGTMLVGEVHNNLVMRPYDPAATEDTASVFFAFGMVDSKKNYKFLKPSMLRPPDTLQYRNSAPEFAESPFLFFNGEFYMDSPHTASMTSLTSSAASAKNDASGNPLIWRITKYQNNSFDGAMKMRLFKDANYIPQNTFDFLKILGEYNGTTPVEVLVTPADYVSSGSVAGIKAIWNQPDVEHYLDRGETPGGSDPNGNENTLTKFETWVYSGSGDDYRFTYSGDMYCHIFLNGEPLPDDFNIYNMDENQRRNRMEVPLSAGSVAMLSGWNHIAVYVLHSKNVSTNGVNGICYKLDGVSRTEAFGGSYTMNLWKAHPMPQPNYYDFSNNGRGTSVVVYKKQTDGSEAIAANKSGVSPAIYGAHKGVFFADKNALDTIVASKPVEGGDHKMSVGIVSNESLANLEPRFASTAYGEEGYIKIHVNQTPYSPTDVKRLWDSTRFVCNDPYADVESVNTLTPTIRISESAKLDPDNPSESYGFHHSLYYTDYKPAYLNVPSVRTDEVRYVYTISELDIDEKFSSLLFGALTYKAPFVINDVFMDYMPASHTIPLISGGNPVLREARNIGGVIGPIYNYRVWAKDEHGELQNIGSPVKRFCCDMRPPVVADINVYYDKEGGVRLDGDISPFVENDKSLPGTNPIALVGHTLTFWAFCTDEITADPRKFTDGKFLIRRSGSADPWLEIDATCEVDTNILFEDLRFAFNRVPSEHPNGYWWYAFYTIPYNADLVGYDVDFQITDAVGNRSKMLTDASNDVITQNLAKNQFRVSTMRLNNASIVPTLRTTTISVAWQPFKDLRDNVPVDHYIVSMGDLTPNPFETSTWVAGNLTACTREVRVEGKLPVFIIPSEKIGTVGFGTDFNDFIYSFEDPNSVTNFMDGWRELASAATGDYFSADTKKVKGGMYSWSNFMKAVPGDYQLYKDFHIGSNIKVAFGAWIRKEVSTSKTKLQVICYDSNDNPINPNANGATYETVWDAAKSTSWVHFYVRNPGDEKPFIITPLATHRVRLIIAGDSGSKIYVDQVGFAAYSDVTVDFTPPPKPDIKVGVFNHHVNTGDQATVYGCWDGQWDIKGSAWLDEPSNFPTLLAANIVNFPAAKELKKVGQYSYKVVNGNPNTEVGYFQNADIKLNVESGDILRIWAYLQNNGKSNAMRKIENLGIAISDGSSWSARVAFGSNAANVDQAFVAAGLTSETSIINLGPLPDAGKWVPIDIPVNDVGLAGREILGMAFAIDGTYEASVVPPAVLDTVAVYIDFIDIDCGAGVKSYLPQLEINRDDKGVFQDLSTLRTSDGTIEAGFMIEPTFDDPEFIASGLGTTTVAFTDKQSILVSSAASGSATYTRTGLTAQELVGIPPVAVSSKLICNWSPVNDGDKVEYNGGAIVFWAQVTNADYSRDSLSELNVGLEYSTLSEPKLLAIAKYRAATMSPKSRKPPEFNYLRDTAALSTDEVRASADAIATYSLYQISDSFETVLPGAMGITFHRNFIDAGKLPATAGEWVPIVIPVRSLIPNGLLSSIEDKVTIKRLYIEAANCDVYVDHIGKTTAFKQFGDWQENMHHVRFVNDISSLTYDEIHNTEQKLEGTESIKISRVGVGQKNFYIRLNKKHDPYDDIPAFDPAPFYLDVPATGGVFSLNVYIGTDEATLPGELMVEFHRVGDPDTVFNYRAFWGSQFINVGVPQNDVPAHYYVGPLPDVRGGWAELLVPSGILEMNGMQFDGVNVRVYSKSALGTSVWVDRVGMLGIVPHGGEAVKHSVYAWGLDDYTFYSMRVKSWDKVLNESDYSYSRYVRSKDRTAPVIQASMTPRINYKGHGIKEPFGGVYYIKTDGVGNTSEVPLFFTDNGLKTGNYVSDKEVDLSITTEDYLSFETLDSSRANNNKVSVGIKQFKDETSAEVFVTQATAYDPLPSAQYINSEWLTDVKALGQAPEKDIVLNDTTNVWLVDPLKRYSKVRYYYMNSSNYIARQIVYDDENNFIVGGDTYVDVTPGQLARLAFYYPDTTVVEIRSAEPAFIDTTQRDQVNPSTRSWVGVSAYDAQGNSILKGTKIKLKWQGYFKGIRGSVKDMNATLAETERRMQITPGGSLDPTKPLRTYYEPPPRPYFQIDKSSNSVELARKLLTPDQLVAPAVTYCTQEVGVYTYTGYNIKGEGYEVGVGAGAIKNNLVVSSGDPKGTLKSGDLEAYFLTTTRAGDVFWVTATNDAGNIMAQSTKFRVVPSGLAEMQVDPQEAEVDAEGGQATFVVKGFDSFRNRLKYVPKYHTPETFLIDYFNEDEKSTYEFCSTNEIIVSPLWTTDSHEVAYSPSTGKYDILNGETVGTFLSSGRTSSNTFGAGWEQGTKSIVIVDTTDVMITDGFGNTVNAAVSYTGTKFLSSGAELRYGMQTPPKGKGWDINNADAFITAKATVFVRPLLKGYLGFVVDDKQVQETNMNAVLDDSDLSDALKLRIQTFDDHHQATAYDSFTEVIVRVDTSEDEFTRIHPWPVVKLANGVSELRVKLDRGSSEVGLVAFNSRLKPTVRLISLNPNYKDINMQMKQSELKVTVLPNRLDHIVFDPNLSNSKERYSVVKGKAHPIKAFGYDFRSNPVEPIDYNGSPGWTVNNGLVESEYRSQSYLSTIFNARDLVPPPGSNIPVDITVNAKALFKKLAAPAGSATREVGVEYKVSGLGYMQVVNFGLLPFPCVYQVLDREKLDKEGEYELSFIYMTGNSGGDARPATPKIGIAFCRNETVVTSDDIYMLYSKPLNTGGYWSGSPMKLRFKMDGGAASESGVSGVNSLDASKRVILFLGAPETNADRPAIRFDHVTIERVN